MIAFHKQPSLLHRTDPLGKLVLLFCIALLTMRFHSSLGQALLLAAVFALARWAGGMPWKKQAKALAILLGFAVPYFIVTLLTAAGEHVFMQLGPLRLTTEALDSAGSVTVRMFTVFLSSYVFMFTTDPRDMVVSLTTRLRIPYTVCVRIIDGANLFASAAGGRKKHFRSPSSQGRGNAGGPSGAAALVADVYFGGHA